MRLEFVTVMQPFAELQDDPRLNNLDGIQGFDFVVYVDSQGKGQVQRVWVMFFEGVKQLCLEMTELRELDADEIGRRISKRWGLHSSQFEVAGKRLLKELQAAQAKTWPKEKTA